MSQAHIAVLGAAHRVADARAALTQANLDLYIAIEEAFPPGATIGWVRGGEVHDGFVIEHRASGTIHVRKTALNSARNITCEDVVAWARRIAEGGAA